MRRLFPIAVLAALAARPEARAVPSLVEEVSDGVYMVYDDTGRWGGVTMGRTHQNSPQYQAKKVLNLSDVPLAVWEATRAVRLSLYTGILDYSFHDNPPADGLDEAFEVVINGRVHRFADDCGIPPYLHSATPAMAWYDMAFPKAEFASGGNEVILRKAPDDENDDYLYVGIATGQSRGNSMVSFDGATWTAERLTRPGGSGEYMVRLYLITTDLSTAFSWRPAADRPLEEPDGLVLYAGARDVAAGPGGLPLPVGAQARVEWDAGAIDRLEPLTLAVEATAPFELAWLGEDGEPGDSVVVPAHHNEVPAGTLGAPHPTGIAITPRGPGWLSAPRASRQRATSAPCPRPSTSARPSLHQAASHPGRRRPAASASGRSSSRMRTCAAASGGARGWS